MKGNLLIVDDETALSQAMKELLEDEAEQIFTADNGEEGLSIIDHNPIDCVVSDIKMPVMDGLHFIQEARNHGYDRPFIFFTGHGSEDLRKEVCSLGAMDLLNKPNFAGLEKSIRKAFESIDPY